MTGHTGAREETVGLSGPFRILLALPFALALFGGRIVLALKGTAYVAAFLPDFHLWVDVIVLAILVGLLFYGAFRTADLIHDWSEGSFRTDLHVTRVLTIVPTFGRFRIPQQ